MLLSNTLTKISGASLNNPIPYSKCSVPSSGCARWQSQSNSLVLVCKYFSVYGCENNHVAEK